MWILFDDLVRVDHHQFSIGGVAANPVSYGRGGQVNGLCGAAEPGILVFTTGREYGEVPLRIEEHEAVPTLDPVWTEVVEASFTPAEPEVLLMELNFVDDPPERYLLQFWPARTAPDRIVRQTSTVAAYWHRVAQRTTPAEQRAMAAWVARCAADRAGHATLDWVAEALDALDRGAPLPPSFTDVDTALHRLWDVSAGAVTHQVTVTVTSGLGSIELPGPSPEVAMIFTILATRDDDPLAAALRTLTNTLDGGPVDLAAFRAAFHLTTPRDTHGATDEPPLR